MVGSLKRTTRLIVMLVLTLASTGCISFETHPQREVGFELTGAAGRSPSEWWVLSWQDQSKCDIGLVWGFPHGGPFGWPSTFGRSQVRLFHMTPETPTMTWTGSYDWYLWYLIVLPPLGGAWNGWTHFVLVAPGGTGRWEFEQGSEYPWEFQQDPADGSWRARARNEAPKREELTGEATQVRTPAWVIWEVSQRIEDLRAADPALVRREDLKSFLRVVLENSRGYERCGGSQDQVREFLEELSD